MKSIVNLIFIGIFFVCPFAYAWHFPEHTAGAVVIGFMIASLLIADWYHLHLMKTYKNCLFWMVGSGLLAATIFTLFMNIYGFNPFLKPNMISESAVSRVLFKILVTSLGIVCISTINIPRIGLLKIMKLGRVGAIAAHGDTGDFFWIKNKKEVKKMVK